MLVLTRKVDEQILIGDDIKITVIRVRGNNVRIGIEAPRSVRVVRGELPQNESAKQAVIKQEIDIELDGDMEIDDLAEIFAHPESQRVGRPKTVAPARKAAAVAKASTNRMNRIEDAAKSTEVFVGTVNRSGDDVKLSRAPLSSFMSAS